MERFMNSQSLLAEILCIQYDHIYNYSFNFIIGHVWIQPIRGQGGHIDPLPNGQFLDEEKNFHVNMHLRSIYRIFYLITFWFYHYLGEL